MLKEIRKFVVKEKDGNIEGIYESSKSFSTIPAQTIASQCRAKNKIPDENGFVYFWLEDYPEDKIKTFFKSTFSSSPVYPPPSQQLNLVLTLGGKLVSVNDLYKARVIYKGGRPMATIYKNPRAVEVSKEIYKQLSSVDFKPWIEWLNNTKAYKISINFVVKSGISRRDVENLGKSLIDTVVRHLREVTGVKHFDDSEFLEIYFTKSIIPGSKHEYAMINLQESSHNPRFDYIPTPNKFYIGGDMLSQWKQEIIEKLEEQGKKWYAPELKPWSPEEWGIEESKNCNTYLEILDHSKEGFSFWPKFKALRDRIYKLLDKNDPDKFLYIGFMNFPENLKDPGNLDFQELLNISHPNLICKRIDKPIDLIND